MSKSSSHGGVFDTWTRWAKPQAERAQGPADRPNSLAASHVLCQFGPWLRGHVSTQGVEGQGGVESQWRSRHPAGQPLGLAGWPPLGAKLMSPSRWNPPPPPRPYKYPPTVKMRTHTTFWRFH
jgi:hypothetical protein